MLTIAGGIVLGLIGIVVAYFVLAFLIMYVAEAWNHMVSWARRSR